MVRPSKKNTVVAIMNMSAEPQTVTVDMTGYTGKYTCLCGHKHKLRKHETFNLKPWQYKILTK
ncbi:MAG: alpha-amylase, partial [Paludibacteraceae bacterium]|nr:alpha-amylase [Paludibacteraceae bacterium]